MPLDDNIPQADTEWTTSHASGLYHLQHWNGGYFQINAVGELSACHRNQSAETGVSLLKVINRLQSMGIELPVLLRFRHILQDRLQVMYEAIDEATKTYAYQGRYRAVYPIKVNQQYSVVETLKQHGGQRFGFEAGSKAELMAVLALSCNDSGLVICNGYKDRDYIRLALIGMLLGIEAYIIIEKYSELQKVLSEADTLNVVPRLGLRVRLSSTARGKWQNSGGEKSKFGLSASEILKSVELLKNHNRLECVQLLHFHIGSQITDISDVENGLREATRFYQQLRRYGLPIRTLDVGGGLGVDYEGTESTSYCSTNYSVEQYMEALVRIVCEECNSHQLPHPDLLTEAGRAMTAHHAVLLTNVIDAEHKPEFTLDFGVVSSDHPLIHKLQKIHHDVTHADAGEQYSRACVCLKELQTLFIQDRIDLAEYADAEQIYYRICQRLLQVEPENLGHDLRSELHDRLASKYFCNFSVFQSLPDIWAFEQVFPIMPVHRLDARPLHCARLQDLTCDSDGQVPFYVTEDGVRPSLPLHAVHSDENYVLGVFLVGAYQEILGDMHNLFGDTHSVDIDLEFDGKYTISSPEKGDTVDELLRYVHLDPEVLRHHYQTRILNSVLDSETRMLCEQEIEKGFTAYSYHVNS